MRRFAELFHNPVVSEVTREMVVTFVSTISDLSDHRKLPSSMRGSLCKMEGLPKVSAKTVERHLVTIKALLTFCVSEGWISNNVANGIPLPKDNRPKASKRRSFTKSELEQLLARTHEEYGEGGDMTWLVKLAAYTGCRLEELAQLATSNVREVEGVWVIDINDLDGRHVKTQSSVRMVPLHPDIREDFVKWVQSNPGKRVFESFTLKSGRYSTQLSGDFARLMDRAGLDDPRLVFHSLRHTLKRAMSNARVDIEARKAILGHAPTDAHGGYEGHSLAALSEELARVPAMY